MDSARHADHLADRSTEPWSVDRGRDVRPWRPERPVDDDPVRIDCDSCAVRGLGCGDCVVTVLLGGPPFGVELDGDEQRALEALADGGLVPPLRMETADADDPSGDTSVVRGPWE